MSVRLIQLLLISVCASGTLSGEELAFSGEPLERVSSESPESHSKRFRAVQVYFDDFEAQSADPHKRRLAEIQENAFRAIERRTARMKAESFTLECGGRIASQKAGPFLVEIGAWKTIEEVRGTGLVAATSRIRFDIISLRW